MLPPVFALTAKWTNRTARNMCPSSSSDGSGRIEQEVIAIAGRRSALVRRQTFQSSVYRGPIFLPVDLHSEVWEFSLVHRTRTGGVKHRLRVWGLLHVGCLE